MSKVIAKGENASKTETKELVFFNDTKKGAQEFKDAIGKLKQFPKSINRTPAKKHIEKMKESIREIGVRRMLNVVRTSRFNKNGVKESYIADASHLAKAILDTPIEELYGTFIIEILDIDEEEKMTKLVTKLNSTAKVWSYKEYLDIWVGQGLKHYIALDKVCKRTGYSASSLFETYTGIRPSSGKNNSDFKLGKFKMNTKRGNKLLSDYKNLLNLGLCNINASFLAYVRICTDFPNLNRTSLAAAVGSKNSNFETKMVRETYLTLFRMIVQAIMEIESGKVDPNSISISKKLDEIVFLGRKKDELKAFAKESAKASVTA